MKRARILWTAGAFLLALLLFWYGGIDYLQRGFESAWSVATSIAVAFWVWSWPGWRRP